MTSPSKACVELARIILEISETDDLKPPYRCLAKPDGVWLELKIKRVAYALQSKEEEIASLKKERDELKAWIPTTVDFEDQEKIIEKLRNELKHQKELNSPTIDGVPWYDHLKRVETSLQALREGLLNFGKHPRTCASQGKPIWVSGEVVSKKCDCEFGKLLEDSNDGK